MSDIVNFLKVHEYFRGLDDEILDDISEYFQIIHYNPGECLHNENEPLRAIYFVTMGRLKAVSIDAQGHEHFFKFFGRGHQCGLLGSALSEPLPMRVTAVDPTTVLKLDYDIAFDLTLKHLKLRRHWTKTFANQLRKVMFPESPERKRNVLAIVHESSESREITKRLISRLEVLGEDINLLSDQPDIKSSESSGVLSLLNGTQRIGFEELRHRLGSWPDLDRVIVDIDAATESPWLLKLIESSDHVLWCVSLEQVDSAINHLRMIESQVSSWRDKISIVWQLESQQIAPIAQELRDLSQGDFKIFLDDDGKTCGVVASGVERIVHYLRGIRIGLALGGGASRGMAHLGVLKALDEQGIVVDMIAGTSSGAMTGSVYASGLAPDYATKCFARDLKPSLPFRLIPQGAYWYLMYCYRRGRFDKMLRPYLKDTRLEQLIIPILPVTLDLIAGTAVIRECGDTIHSILESINLPVLSIPICRNGQALIDGWLVKNVPADVLISKGCNFVIAVNVTAKMEHSFGRNQSNTPTEKMKSPGVMQTLLRSFMVQSYNMNSIGANPANITIEPDVTEFDLSEFTRATEIAAIGELTTLREIPRIKKLLNRMDEKLFPKE